jgi:STE24 endopeptidase
MLLPFLICVLILYVPLPGLGGAPGWPLGLTGVVVLALVNVGAGWLCSRLAVRMTARSGLQGRLAASRLFTLLKGVMVGFVAADVFVFKWPLLVERILGDFRWALLAGDLLLLLPAIVMALTIMAWQHRFEARLGQVSIPLPRYLWLRLRLELGIVLVPWLILVFAADLTFALFHGSEYLRLVDTIVSGGVLAGIVVFSPALLRRVWRSSSLPPGRLRDRLERLCEENEFSVNDILVWHTEGHLANAGVIGPTPIIRYVMITDALLDQCTEQETAAIFAHEIGHVKLRHLPFYAFMAVGFLALYANLMDLAAMTGQVRPLGDILAFDMTLRQALVLLGFAVIYWVPIFGYVSRRFELEADLFAIGSVEDPVSFLTALEKLSAMSSSPRSGSHWRHFSVERRVDFLADVLERPDRGDRFLRRIYALKAVTIGVLVLAAARLVVWRPELFGL